MANAYTADGVNVSEGDLFSAFAGDVCRKSYDNSPYVEVHDFSRGHFRGPRSFTFHNLPEGYTMDAAPDGIGTKVVIIDAASAHSRASCDVIAMTEGDITRFGGMSLVFVNVLDVSTLGQSKPDAGVYSQMVNHQLRNLIEGMGQVCKEQQIVAFKGETAELGPCVGSENPDAATKFNWAGMMIGVYHPRMMITGDALKPGQWIMALEEQGLRCNGISSVRKAFVLKFGREWWRNPEAAGSIVEASRPAALYGRFLTDANGWHNPPSFAPKIKMHLIVHVTGGAIRSKLAEDVLFPRGFGADLLDLCDPPQIMEDCFNWRNLDPGNSFTDEDAYETWHGGQGALVVIDKADYRDFRILAHSHGIGVCHCGIITDKPIVTIHSKFTGKQITYEKK